MLYGLNKTIMKNSNIKIQYVNKNNNYKNIHIKMGQLYHKKQGVMDMISLLCKYSVFIKFH